MPTIGKVTQAKVNDFALLLLNFGMAPISTHLFSNEDTLKFEEICEKVKSLDVEYFSTPAFSKEESIAIQIITDAMERFRVECLVNQDMFFTRIVESKSSLKNKIIKNGNNWGLIETQYLTQGKQWYGLDGYEIHIDQTLPRTTNSSLWLSEFLCHKPAKDIYIRPDVFRLNPEGTSKENFELSKVHGRPFNKEWLNTLRTVEIAEHIPDSDNPLEKGERTQFIWEYLKSEKKIQFSVEELPEEYSKKICTRFIHGIYDTKLEKFEHLDGAIHIYSSDEYQKRKRQNLKGHNKNYSKAKIFLINTGITIKDGEKLLSSFYRRNDMPRDYFSFNN